VPKGVHSIYGSLALRRDGLGVERDHSARHEGACGPIDVQIVVDRRRLTNYPKDIVFTVKAKPATIYAPIAQESLALVLPAFPTYITSPSER
jgi:hypothetical protein